MQCTPCGLHDIAPWPIQSPDESDWAVGAGSEVKEAIILEEPSSSVCASNVSLLVSGINSVQWWGMITALMTPLARSLLCILCLSEG